MRLWNLSIFVSSCLRAFCLLTTQHQMQLSVRFLPWLICYRRALSCVLQTNKCVCPRICRGVRSSLWTGSVESPHRLRIATCLALCQRKLCIGFGRNPSGHFLLDLEETAKYSFEQFLASTDAVCVIMSRMSLLCKAPEERLIPSSSGMPSSGGKIKTIRFGLRKVFPRTIIIP